MSNMEILFKTPLRKLNDTLCSIVVNTRGIRKLVSKNPSLAEMNMDCWTADDNQHCFLMKNGKLQWRSKKAGIVSLDNLINDEDCDFESANKLLVYTYRNMCELLASDGIQLDSDEDLLEYANALMKEYINEGLSDE